MANNKDFPNKYLIGAGVAIIGICAMYLFYWVLFFNTTLFWKTYNDENISFRYSPDFMDHKEYEKEKYLCTKPNRLGLDDCISYEFIDGKLDENEIHTTGGNLVRKDLGTVSYGGRNFLMYTDGDAAYFYYAYIYELPDQDAYYKIKFMSNTYSSWRIGQDIETILSKIELKR